MGTQRNADFADMLNEYLPNKLLREEFKKRNWFLSNVEHDTNWLSGDIIVPFKAAQASSVKMGGLTDSAKIGQSKTVRGKKEGQPEAWGSLIFNAKDIMQHGKISRDNFLKLLPDELDDFFKFMKRTTSHQFLNGPSWGTLTFSSLANGQGTFVRPERLEIGQLVQVSDDVMTLEGFVGSVDLDTGEVQLVKTRYADPTNSANFLDCTGMEGLELNPVGPVYGAKLYIDGAEDPANRFSSVIPMLLSAANGGDATIYGKRKLDAPYTQAIQISGSSITGGNTSNILSTIFDGMVKMRTRGAPGATKVLMSYKYWGIIMKVLEKEKGPFRRASDVKASVYGWDEVEVAGPGGHVTCVALEELNDGVMPIIDPSAFKIHSNGGFRKHADPEGKEYYVVRGAGNVGYQYIVDLTFQGDAILYRPNRCGIIHSVPQNIS